MYPPPQTPPLPSKIQNTHNHNNSYQQSRNPNQPQLIDRSTLHITSLPPSTLSLPTPHPLKLPHKRFLNLLVPRPRLAHLLHAQRSNHRETERAQRRLLLAYGGVGRDADVFQEAEVGGVAVGVQSQ